MSPEPTLHFFCDCSGLGHHHLSSKCLPHPHHGCHHLAALASRPHTAASGPLKLTNDHVSHLKQPLDDGLLTAESPKAPLASPLTHAAQPGFPRRCSCVGRTLLALGAQAAQDAPSATFLAASLTISHALPKVPSQ